MFASRNVGRPNSSFFSFALCLFFFHCLFLSYSASPDCVSMKLLCDGPTSDTAVSHKSASSFNRYIDRASLCVSQCVPLTLSLFFLLSVHIPMMWLLLSPFFSLPCLHLTFLFSLFSHILIFVNAALICCLWSIKSLPHIVCSLSCAIWQVFHSSLPPCFKVIVFNRGMRCWHISKVVFILSFPDVFLIIF